MHVLHSVLWSLPAILLLVLQPLVTSLKHKNMECDKLQECVCGFPSGEGVNLTSLASKPIVLNDTERDKIFHFNPCSDVLSPCPNGTVLCMVDTHKNRTVSIGLKGMATYFSQGVYGPIFISYTNDTAEAEVELKCSEKGKETILEYDPDYDEPENPLDPELEIYHLILHSPEACLKPVQYTAKVQQFTYGEAFLLFNISVFCSYLLIGAAINKFLHGATGWEVIPNYEFWRGLPDHFMQTAKFIANGCKEPPSYEQI